MSIDCLVSVPPFRVHPGCYALSIWDNEVRFRESKVPDLSQDRYYHGGHAVDDELLATFQEDETGWGFPTIENSVQSERRIRIKREGCGRVAVDPQAGFGAEKADARVSFSLRTA